MIGPELCGTNVQLISMSPWILVLAQSVETCVNGVMERELFGIKKEFEGN
jgi:hypothetical protein